LKLLLDTHIWLWSVLEPHRLGPRVAQELRNSEGQIWLSPISTWEALVLFEKGKIRLQGDPASWVSTAIAPFQEAPLTHEIALVAQQLGLPQKDPADRFLAATARVLSLTLVTADVSLLGLGEIATLANR